MKRLLILAVSLGFIWASSLSPSGAADTPKRGGTLTMAIRKDLSVMNPLVRTLSTDQAIRELMFESFLGIDRKGNIQPNLAESWKISNDGLLYTFTLRKGVKFHDGQEMTAEDAKFAIDYTLNPKNGAYGLAKLNLVDRAEATDRYTVRIFLKKASPGFLSSLINIQAFSVIPKESVQEGIDKPVKFPAGTGPFKFVEWQPGRSLVLGRHEEYWGHKAFLERLILRPIADDSTRITALRAGDIDLSERTPYEWVRQIVDGKLKGIGYAEAASGGFRTLKFNVAGAPFDNKKLRQAVGHAINKREILQAAYLGFGEPGDQKYSKGHVWYFEGITSPAYDLNKARALLKEAGYKGETIPIMARQGADQETEALTLQAQLKKIGMNIKLEVLESGSYNSRQRQGDFAFMFYGGSNDPDPSPTYAPDLLCEADLKKRSSNVTGYCDKEMDALLKKAETELDLEKRKSLFRQIVTKVAVDLPEVYIGSVPRYFTFRSPVKGFTTDDEGAFRSWSGGLHYTWLDK